MNISAPTPIEVAQLRQRIQSRYIGHPDSSHGQDYINHGIRIALAAINELAGDVVTDAQCSRRTYTIGLEWCSVHHGPYEQSEWACRFATRTWQWGPTLP